MSQGYLLVAKGISLRVRCTTHMALSKYYMTFKSAVNGRVIEIEKKINQRDFNDLWKQCLNKLIKHRHEFKDSAGEIWEIDFFKDHNNETYFAVAEIEMPEGQQCPRHIPNIISNNLLYEVSLTDCRFSSKLLSDVRYAIDLYKNIGEPK